MPEAVESQSAGPGQGTGMRYCVMCVSPATRPNLEFSADGVCSACEAAAAKKDEIDWVEREAELRKLFDRHRSAAPTRYDCIVPVSGGKDSTYQVHIVKNVHGMNPLCLTFRTLARTPRGEENLQSLREMGVDHVDFSPNPIGVNKLTRRAFREFGDCSLLDHLAIYTIVPRFAVQMRIPLVIWGENPYFEYGGEAEQQQLSRLTEEFVREHDILKNMTAEDWSDDDLPLQELQSMIYPNAEELEAIRYEPIFLGFYLPWDAQENVRIAKEHGFKPREQGPIMGLYDYADIDCVNIVIHHYFKWLKFGFNRVTDHASNEIRKGRMTRDEAIDLVGRLDGMKPPKQYIANFCAQIEITEDEFWAVAERYRNLDIWKQNEAGEWYIDGWIGGNESPDRFPHTPL